MADNTLLNAGTGGDTIATDELSTLNGGAVSGIKVQRMKVGFGSDAALRDVDAANPLPVSGPVTDTQLRATAVPVSGTFFQATQPVSLATDTPDVTDRAARLLGVVASITAALPVGANIIGAVTGPTADDAANPALKLGTLPGVALAAAPVRTQGAVNPLRLNLAGDAAITLDGEAVVLGAGTASVGTVQPPAITKGTQGTVGFTIQRLTDAGRNARHFMLDAFTAAPVAEAVQSVVQWYGNAAVAATTQPAVVPAGKTLRLTTWAISTKSLATVGSAVVRVRVNTGGLGVLASPLVFSFEVGSRAGATTVAMTGGLATITGVFPEGFEIPAGAGLAFSMAGYGPAGVLTLQGMTRFAVYGYEY